MKKVIEVEVVEIAEFRGNGEIESLEFSSNVRKIGKAAFMNCKNLKKITFREGIETIDEAAFFGCSSLKEVYLPKSLKELGKDVFRNGKNLDMVEISDGLLLKMPYDAFSGCPCEEELMDRRNFVKESLRKEEEKVRIVKYRELFEKIFKKVMNDENSDYTRTYRIACETFAGKGNLTGNDMETLEKLYLVQSNGVADVGHGCIDIQFASHNKKGKGTLCWAGLDKGKLAEIANAVRSVDGDESVTLQKLEDLWKEFVGEVGGLKLRQVFTRLIAALRPDLVTPCVHPEAVDGLYSCFTENGFIIGKAESGKDEVAWLKNWFVQNRRIKDFLSICLGKGDYETGPFVWYLAEFFRKEAQDKPVVRERRERIRDILAISGCHSLPSAA